MIDGTSLGRVGTCKVLEVKAFLVQLLAGGEALPTRIQLRQDIMVAGSQQNFLSRRPIKGSPQYRHFLFSSMNVELLIV